MQKKLSACLVSLVAVSAFAQAQLGTITSVNGVATVTTGTVGTAISAGAPIVDGARVITTSSGTVNLRLNNGCTATVPPGHAVTVLASLSCDQLRAAIQPVNTAVTTTTAPAVAGAAAVPTPSTGVLAGLAAVLAIGAIAASDDDGGNNNNATPNPNQPGVNPGVIPPPISGQ